MTKRSCHVTKKNNDMETISGQWGWESYFSELARFVQSSERQYEGAN